MRNAIGIVCALLFSTSLAHAHIVADPKTSTQGAWFKTALRVTHGCDGEDTTAISVTIPNDILMVKPQAKAGWTIRIDTQKLDKPVAGPHGKMIDTVTTQITWSGNTLADAHFDEFGLSMKLLDRKGVLVLPVTQKCVTKSTLWHETPDADGHAHHPAPIITVE